MKVLMLLAAAVAALTVGGCTRKDEAASPSAGPLHRGRFSAVGLYAPGQMWRQLAASAPTKDGPPADPAAASLDDDEQILVVLDSATGEVRQCGNLSGRCIAMNPWSKPVGGAPAAPAALLKHAGQLQAEWEKAHPPADVHVRVEEAP